MRLALTVDGVHYNITEPRPFSKSYASEKEGNDAALGYEFVLHTHKPKLAWMNGPFPAGKGDKYNLRQGLLDAIRKKQRDRGNNAKIIADKGYWAVDLLDAISLRNEFDPSHIKRLKDNALSRQETFNGWTKDYKCCIKKFLHDRGHNPNQEHPRHKACVEAICVTIQYELDLGCKHLFDPYPM